MDLAKCGTAGTESVTGEIETIPDWQVDLNRLMEEMAKTIERGLPIIQEAVRKMGETLAPVIKQYNTAKKMQDGKHYRNRYMMTRTRPGRAITIWREM